MLTPALRRGLAAGVLAGVLAGTFALTVGEIPVREAIAIEEAAEALADDPATTSDPASDDPTTAQDDPAAADDDGVEVSRRTQETLLPVATAIVGAAFGGLFALAYVVVRPRLRTRRDWVANLQLGAVAWSGFVLLPALTSPPDPPAVGDPATISTRTGWYLATIAFTLLLAWALWRLADRLRVAGELRDAHRQVLIGLVAVVAAAVVVTLAPNSEPAMEVPADLLWRFRLASIATQTLLWAGIAVASGLLWDRAAAATERAQVAA